MRPTLYIGPQGMSRWVYEHAPSIRRQYMDPSCTVRSICRDHQVSVGTVQRVINAYGDPRRPKGGGNSNGVRYRTRLQFVREHRYLTVEELVAELKVTRACVHKYLRELKEEETR